MPRICVVIPVYNHALTVGIVVQGAQSVLPVIVVDDGSTDATPTVLAGLKDLTVVTLSPNRGKAAALKAGFARARDLGFSHAITLDADGQHPTAALGVFVEACHRHPEALIVGVRDLNKEGAPWPRRWSNHLSTFWFRAETGVPLCDTQCGYRCYPLERVIGLRVASPRYAWELEVMAQAAWAGVPLVPQPVRADYRAPTSRLSHFKPWRDMLQISRVHARLCMQAFCLPRLLRQARARADWSRLPFRERCHLVSRLVFSEHTQTPGKLALAVGTGLFCGIVPIWGYQMMAAALLAHRFRFNKAIALAASNISIPLLAPFIIAASLALGHYLRTGQQIDLRPEQAARQIPTYLGEYLLGSVVLAVIVGAAGGIVAYVIAWGSRRRCREPGSGGGV